MNFLVIKLSIFILYDCLIDKNINVRNVIFFYRYKINYKKLKKEVGFDVIFVYGKFSNWDDIIEYIFFDWLSKKLD